MQRSRKVRQSLPATAVITTNRLTFATFPILGYALTADNRGAATIPQTRLWEIATYDLKPPLNRVDGVSTVTVQGGQVPEYHIIPNLARLQNSGVTLTDLVNSVDASNIVDSPGLYEANHELILALVGAQAHDAAHLASLVVKTTPSGAPVRVSDVAEVRPGTEPLYTTVTANGVPSVLLNIARQPTSNTVRSPTRSQPRSNNCAPSCLRGRTSSRSTTSRNLYESRSPACATQSSSG